MRRFRFLMAYKVKPANIHAMLNLIFDNKSVGVSRVKWGKVSHLFSWLRGGETMKIELFIR